MKNMRLLSGNTLKIIAMLTMLVDHIGYILFPNVLILRIIGRISLPIFAFMIGEGCIYTRNKLKYFLGIFLLAVLCQIGYFIAGFGLDLSILVTFSYSLLIIFSLQNLREKIINGTKPDMLFAYALSVMMIGATYIVNRYYRADYGFWGCMLPAFAYFAVFISEEASTLMKVAFFAVGLLILCWRSGGIQYYSLLSLPLLLLYSGKRGQYNIKHLFYLFYPTHLVILYLIKCLY